MQSKLIKSEAEGRKCPCMVIKDVHHKFNDSVEEWVKQYEVK